MAKTKEPPPSLSAYFKELFRQNQEWLEPGTNEAVINRWRADHPGKEMTANIKGIMSNVKSRMNKELGRKGRRRRRRRKAGAEAGAAPGAVAVRGRPRLADLDALEEQIDRCLSLARRQEEMEGFDGVIKHLRAARNGVVWMIGQPMFKS